MQRSKRASTLELAVILFVGTIAAAFFLTQLAGCGTITMRYDSSGTHPDTRR